MWFSIKHFFIISNVLIKNFQTIKTETKYEAKTRFIKMVFSLNISISNHLLKDCDAITTTVMNINLLESGFR